MAWDGQREIREGEFPAGPERRQEVAAQESEETKESVIAADALPEEDMAYFPEEDTRIEGDVPAGPLQEPVSGEAARTEESTTLDGRETGFEEQLHSVVEAYFSGDASSEDVCSCMNQAFTAEDADSEEVYRAFGSAAGEFIREDNLESAGELLAYTAFGIVDEVPFTDHLDRLEKALSDALPFSFPGEAMDALHTGMESVFSENAPHVAEMGVMGVMIETDGQRCEVYDSLSGEPYKGSDLEALEADLVGYAGITAEDSVVSDTLPGSVAEGPDLSADARTENDAPLPDPQSVSADDGEGDPDAYEGAAEPLQTDFQFPADEGIKPVSEEVGGIEDNSDVRPEGYAITAEDIDPAAAEMTDY